MRVVWRRPEPPKLPGKPKVPKGPKDPATIRPLGEAYFKTLPDSQLIGIMESDGWTVAQRVCAMNVYAHRDYPDAEELKRKAEAIFADADIGSE